MCKNCRLILTTTIGFHFSTIIGFPVLKAGGVPTCSPYYLGAFKLAVLGNCYNTYVAKVFVSLWKCDFKTLDQINRKSG